MDNYPGSFTFVQIHLGDAYAISWSGPRAAFYHVDGTPTAWFDAAIPRVGASSSDAAQYNLYRSSYLSRMGVSTDVTMELTGDPIDADTYNIKAEVCIEEGGVGKTMRVHVVQVLDYWPPSPSYSRNGLKQAANSEDVTLAAGECAVVEGVFSFDSTSMANEENIKMIAWAQQPFGSAPAEAFQSAWMGWPFPLSLHPGDLDEDGDVDVVDFDGVMTCSGGPGETTPPSGCTEEAFEAADFDHDGDVDFADVAEFQVAFSGPCGLDITQHPLMATACVGSSAVFEVAVEGHVTHYQWQHDGADIPGANGPILDIASVASASAGSYSVLVSDPCQTIESDAAQLMVFANAPGITNDPASGDYCSGDAIFMIVMTSNAEDFQWYKDGEPIAGASSAFFAVANAQPSDSGIYHVEATNPCGSTSSGDAVVTVIDCAAP